MRGRVGTPVSFQLGVNASFRLEARLLQPEGGRGEVAEVATMEVRERRRNLSAGEQLVAVKQVTTEQFSSSLISEIATMDAAALDQVFDKQLRQRLLLLVQQPVGSRLNKIVLILHNYASSQGYYCSSIEIGPIGKF